MTSLSDEQREAIAVCGTPLPIIEGDQGKAYILLSVNMARTDDNAFRAVAQGVNAMGEGELPSDALFALCGAIQMLAGGHS